MPARGASPTALLSPVPLGDLPPVFQPYALTFVDARHGWLVGGAADAVHVLATGDGGRTWSVTSLGSSPLLPLARAADGTVLASIDCDERLPCDRGLYRAESLGGSYVQVVPGEFRFAALSESIGLAVEEFDHVADGPPPRLWVSWDVGQTWTQTTEPCPDRVLGSATIVAGAALAAVCFEASPQEPRSEVLVTSSDSGSTWQPHSSLPWTGDTPRIQLLPDGSGWLSGPRSDLLETSDGGLTWQPFAHLGRRLGNLLAADRVSRQVGYAVRWSSRGDGSLLMKTIDGGTTWKRLRTFFDPGPSGG